MGSYARKQDVFSEFNPFPSACCGLTACKLFYDGNFHLKTAAKLPSAVSKSFIIDMLTRSVINNDMHTASSRRHCARSVRSVLVGAWFTWHERSDGSRWRVTDG